MYEFPVKQAVATVYPQFQYLMNSGKTVCCLGKIKLMD